jgi:hypothetical protein
MCNTDKTRSPYFYGWGDQWDQSLEYYKECLPFLMAGGHSNCTETDQDKPFGKTYHLDNDDDNAHSVPDVKSRESCADFCETERSDDDGSYQYDDDWSWADDDDNIADWTLEELSETCTESTQWIAEQPALEKHWIDHCVPDCEAAIASVDTFTSCDDFDQQCLHVAWSWHESNPEEWFMNDGDEDDLEMYHDGSELKWSKQCGAESEYPHFYDCVGTKGGKDGALGSDVNHVPCDWTPWNGDDDYFGTTQICGPSSDDDEYSYDYSWMNRECIDLPADTFSTCEAHCAYLTVSDRQWVDGLEAGELKESLTALWSKDHPIEDYEASYGGYEDYWTDHIDVVCGNFTAKLAEAKAACKGEDSGCLDEIIALEDAHNADLASAKADDDKGRRRARNTRPHAAAAAKNTNRRNLLFLDPEYMDDDFFGSYSDDWFFGFDDDDTADDDYGAGHESKSCSRLQVQHLACSSESQGMAHPCGVLLCRL